MKYWPFCSNLRELLWIKVDHASSILFFNHMLWDKFSNICLFHGIQCIGISASISDKSYCKISHSLEAILLPRSLANFKAMWKFQLEISWPWCFTRSDNETLYRILKQCPGARPTDDISIELNWPIYLQSKLSLNCWIAVERAKITFISIHIFVKQNSYHDDKWTL